METTELVADAVRVTSTADLPRIEGPPFEIRFGIEHGEQWPDVVLIIFVGEYRIMAVRTTEPRLKGAAAWLLSEVS